MSEPSADPGAADARGRRNIPRIVHAAAAAVPVVAIAWTLVVGIIAAVEAGDPALLRSGALSGALLLGQAVLLDVFIDFEFVSFRVAALPFGLILPLAYLLTRVRFTSAWLVVRGARFIPVLAGAVAALVTSVVLALLGSFEALEYDLFGEVTLRPLHALIVGGAPWLLAIVMASVPSARRIVLALLIAQVAATVAVMVSVILDVPDSGERLGFLVAAAAVFAVVIQPYLMNLISWIAVLPFGGELGVSLAGESMVSTLYATPDWHEEVGVWVLLVVCLSGVIALAAREGTPRNLSEALGGARRFVLGATLTILPILLLGRVTFSASFDVPGSGFLDVGWDEGPASIGSTGQPLRWLLIAVALGTLHLLVGVVRARNAGLGWVSDQHLATAGQELTRGASGRLRSAAERARLAAEAARAADAATSGGDPGPADSGPPAGPTGEPPSRPG